MHTHCSLGWFQGGTSPAYGGRPNRRVSSRGWQSRWLWKGPLDSCVSSRAPCTDGSLTKESSLELLWELLTTPLSSPCAGWIFGERLHDQERGWFPSNMTEEILNPKIRSQNLKECFRVHKMDDPQRSQNKDRRKLGSRNRQ